MHLFYTPDIEGNDYVLAEQESKHCVRVLRLNINDRINLIDGKGGFFTARIIAPDAKHCHVEIIEKKTQYGYRSTSIHIAIAPTKNIDRFEWFLEKVTEIGISEITPLLCEHSERKEIKPDRLEKVIIAAMKQSYKAYLPRLNAMTKFSDFIEQVKEDQKFIAHCEEDQKTPLKDAIIQGKSGVVLIGPEGDFSIEEIALAKQKNLIPVSLGPSRLRTETAGVVACHTINLMNE